MSRLEELPPDQRAALSILLRQRKTYAEVAGMLGIGEQAVHDRAHAALAVLAPGLARGLDPAIREEIGDYLLSQQPGVAERLRTRTLLSSSLPASRWAQALAAELSGLGELPEIPPAPLGAPPPAPAPAPAQPYSLAEAAASPSLWEPPAAPSSRLGGALLLAAILAAVIVVVILVFAGGGSSKKAATVASTGSTSTSAKTTEPKEEARFPLKPTDPNSRSTGAVEVLSEGSKRAFYIQAEHIPSTNHFFYAIWLYNSPSSAYPLSKSPPVGKSHKLAGAALLPENAGEYKEILLTRETSDHPAHPGHVVLRGTFTLKD
jgi:hypothetical protein